ncbi:MAG: aspartate-alanine antiporter [Candidatus Manganitrophus sp.]|nr:aspartate-alanine antiporter [Candidatus Manganitrophus sp.]MDC4223981.1 aspartate-alanine antiporter [Candidatus Manganitrophus sp.]WDT71817.1 MAG: aspartate-alanine antiporter [Candidatus Manganitrophus sp.]WDT80799.1 MAG: aspartate-alanine antiporter [Candidatus Manganitrophus sp.]
MDWLVETFRAYPELAIFLTLALGYWVGKFKFGSFTLGAVTGTLLVGVVVGQMQIEISPNVKSVFFLMFLFAVGYGVGPQFVRGLKSDGLPQVTFAILQCLVSLLTVFGVAKFLGFNAGLAAGLLSGSQTISAVLGVSTDAINRLGASPEEKEALINAMPVAYAVTYLFGTAGSAWLLASIGPKILRVDLPAECKKLEAKMGGWGDAEAGVASAAKKFDVRAYRVTNERFHNKTVAELEADALKQELRVFIERIRHDGQIIEAEPDSVVHLGDTVAVLARIEVFIQRGHNLGEEVDDKTLLDFPGEVLDIVITDKSVAGMTLKQLAESEIGRVKGRGVFLRKLTRGGLEMPFTPGTVIDRGDVLQVIGPKRSVERVAAELGYADRQTNMTDMVFVGIGIVLGGLVGAIAINIGGVPISLSTSAGTLIAGLIFGWLRSVHRTFGRVPEPALWMMSSVGLNTFIAVVGITSGPAFLAGLQKSGLSLLLAGIVATTVPLLVGVLLGKYVFKFHPAITLGAAAGARTTTAALGLIQDAAKSKTPALGYTVTYAVGNTLLILWGLVIVLLMT